MLPKTQAHRLCKISYPVGHFDLLLSFDRHVFHFSLDGFELLKQAIPLCAIVHLVEGCFKCVEHGLDVLDGVDFLGEIGTLFGSKEVGLYGLNELVEILLHSNHNMGMW